MKRILKTVIVFTMLLMCCGCSALDEASNSLTSAAIANKLDAANKAGMSEKAKVAAEGVQEALDKLGEQTTTWNPFKAMSDDTACMPWNKNRQNKKLNKELNKANSAFDEQLKADNNAGNVQHHQNKMLYIVLLVLILGCVILYLWYKKNYCKPKKKRKAPKVDKEAVTDAAIAAASPVSAKSKTGLFDVYEYQANELKELCSQAGINYDEVLAKHGSDLESITRSYNKLSAMVSRNDTKAVAKFLG